MALIQRIYESISKPLTLGRMGHSFELREMSNRPFVYLDSRSVSPLALSELWDNPSFLFRLCSDSTCLDFCVQDYLICMCLTAAPKFTSSCRLGLRDPRNVRAHGAFQSPPIHCFSYSLFPWQNSQCVLYLTHNASDHHTNCRIHICDFNRKPSRNKSKKQSI